MMTLAQRTLAQVMAGKHLNHAQSKEAMAGLMAGEWTPAQIGAYIAALKMKGEQVEELSGSAEAMREAAVWTPIAQRPILDVVGTGGDGVGTVNVSTLAALLCAAAGVAVAKHGNKAITGQCGSADVLEHLGVALKAEAKYAMKGIDAVGFAFLFAPMFHPAMRHAAVPRREIGVPSMFNSLGPLTNPARAEWMLLGVSKQQDAMRFAQVLQRMGCQRGLVVHGMDGLDEVSLCGPTLLLEVTPDRIAESSITPQEMGLTPCSLPDLQLPNRQGILDAASAIVEGKDTDSPHVNLVLLNAGTALYVAQREPSIAKGVLLAKAVLRDGGLKTMLQKTAAYTQNAP